MAKTRFIICLCILLSVYSGCIVVGVRDRFSFDKSSSDKPIGEFVPDYYVQNNTSRVYLPFFRIDREKPPHDLVLLLYDQTYRQSSVGFETIVLESMTVEYSNGGLVDLLSSKAESERTLPVAHGKAVYADCAKLTLKGAIDRRESFVVILTGKAISSTGEEVPFRSKERYQFDGTRWTCWTLMQELSGA